MAKMKKMTEEEKRSWIIEMGVGYIEFFREFSGLSDEDFLKYMDIYNLWHYLGDYDFLLSTCHWDIETSINFLGQGFSLEKRYEMLMRYKKKYPNAITYDGKEW